MITFLQLVYDPTNFFSQSKWPEQSEELLGLIVNSLRALDSAVPHGCREPRRRPQAVRKIALVLDKAPKQLQQDLISLVPKLVDGSEHSLAACALLDHLQKPDAEPSLRLPVSLPPKTSYSATMGHVLTRDGLQGYVRFDC